jgi:hypothetical protein
MGLLHKLQVNLQRKARAKTPTLHEPARSGTERKLIVDDPIGLGGHWRGRVEIEIVFTPACQLREADCLNFRRYVPDERKLSALDLVQEISQGRCGAGTCFDLFSSAKTEVAEAGLYLHFGSCAWMKRILDACLLKQRIEPFPEPAPMPRWYRHCPITASALSARKGRQLPSAATERTSPDLLRMVCSIGTAGSTAMT